MHYSFQNTFTQNRQYTTSIVHNSANCKVRNKVTPVITLPKISIKLGSIVRFGHGPFSAAIPLQHREAQPQPAVHSCYFRSSNESLYQSQLGGLNCLPQTGFEQPVFGVGSEWQDHYTTRHHPVNPLLISRYPQVHSKSDGKELAQCVFEMSRLSSPTH